MNLREHVVDDMVFNDTVEDVTTDETEFTVYRGSSSLDESPVLGLVMGRFRVCVVEICDGNCYRLVLLFPDQKTESVPIQWFIHK